MNTGDYQPVGKLHQPDPAIWRGERKLRCPACGYTFDAFGNPAHGPIGRPENGDYTCCLDCTAVARFVTGVFGLAVRPATPDEIVEFDTDQPGMRQRLQAYNDGRGGTRRSAGLS